MERSCGSGHSGPANVSAFLTKLWALVSDPATDALIAWSPSGSSFHVWDQGRFAQELLPKYFKHNHMASFVRQLNLYGFRKVLHVQQGSLAKAHKDDTEFQHPDFVRGQERLLENIKRKVASVPSPRPEDLPAAQQDHASSGLFQDVQMVKEKQESMEFKLNAMKQENEALWREVTALQQKQTQQQKVVSKLTQFLISVVQTNQALGMKRKVPLMLNESSSAHSPPKFSCQDLLDNGCDTATPMDSSLDKSNSDPCSPANVGPFVTSITDLPQPRPVVSTGVGVDKAASLIIQIKKEPASSPEQGSSQMKGKSGGPHHFGDVIVS